MDQTIGELALQRGFITSSQWEQVQATAGQQRDPSALLVERGFLSPMQFKRIYAQWKLEERLLADRLVMRGLLRRNDLSAALDICRTKRQQGFYTSLLHGLFERGYVSRSQLAEQARQRELAAYTCEAQTCAERYELQVPPPAPSELPLPCPHCGAALKSAESYEQAGEAFSIIGNFPGLAAPATDDRHNSETFMDVPLEQMSTFLDVPPGSGAETLAGASATRPSQRARRVAKSSTPDPLVGSRLGPWKLERLLGRGGMGAVYRGRHEQEDRLAAIKVILPGAAQDGSFIDRFEREAKSAQAISSDHVIRCLDFQRANPTYMALEFVDGETLKQLIQRKKRLEVEEALDIAAKVLQGLQAAHECVAGVIHRDLKPDNILLGHDGSVKVADFGLARRSGNESLALTVTGTAMGTPHYMSPEQINDAKTVGPRSDLYSFGAMLFHMLAGRPPFMGSDPRTILHQHVGLEPPNLAEYNDKVSAELADFVARLLAKYPDKRYASASAALEALESIKNLGDAGVTHFNELPAYSVELEPGDMVGSWRIAHELGRGGVGIVYEAEKQGQRVAVKILAAHTLSDVTHLMRFHQEWKATSQLDSPHVVEVFEWDQAEVRNASVHYMVMELLTGKSLADRVAEEGLLPVEPARDYVRQAALGLQVAHEKGIVHRDIKPQNILISGDEAQHGSGVAKVADFGLARFYTEQSELTAQQVVGSPYYMSPEQGAGGDVDPRSDIYSLGATFYYALTGARPFTGDTPQAVIYQHGHVLPKPPHERNGSIPKGLSLIVEKMLLKNPEHRYQTMQEIIEALDAQLDGSLDIPELARQVKLGKRAFEPTKRAPFIVLLVALLALAVVLGLTLGPRGESREALNLQRFQGNYRAIQSSMDSIRVTLRQRSLLGDPAAAAAGVQNLLYSIAELQKADSLGSVGQRDSLGLYLSEAGAWKQSLAHLAQVREAASAGSRLFAEGSWEPAAQSLAAALDGGIGADSGALRTMLAQAEQHVETLQRDWRSMQEALPGWYETENLIVALDSLNAILARVDPGVPSLIPEVRAQLAKVSELATADPGAGPARIAFDAAESDLPADLAAELERDPRAFLGYIARFKGIAERADFQGTQGANDAASRASALQAMFHAAASTRLARLQLEVEEAVAGLDPRMPEYYDEAVAGLQGFDRAFEQTESWKDCQQTMETWRQRRSTAADSLLVGAREALASRQLSEARERAQRAKAFGLPSQRAAISGLLAEVARFEQSRADMVAIPSFDGYEMGDDRMPVAKPPQRVAIAGFRIDPQETTVEQYNLFMAVIIDPEAGNDHRVLGFCHPSEPEGYRHTPAGWEAQLDHARWPVTGVSWLDAQAYASWAGKRLPSEAEWELAARGPQRFAFPWGDSWDAVRCRFNADTPVDVGSLPEGDSYFGLADMSGNAAEWTADIFEPYPGGSSNHPKLGKGRVVRGGSFSSALDVELKLAFRFPVLPGEKDPSVGFRCALDGP